MTVDDQVEKTKKGNKNEFIAEKIQVKTGFRRKRNFGKIEKKEGNVGILESLER